jgi:hypothetical protein
LKLQIFTSLFYRFWLRLRSANAISSFFKLINDFWLIPTKDLNEAVGGALTMRMGNVRQGQRK